MTRIQKSWVVGLLAGAVGCGCDKSATEPSKPPTPNGGAAYGEANFRQEPEGPASMVARASATAALFCANAVRYQPTTFRDAVAAHCAPNRCGPHLEALVEDIGAVPVARGIRGAGVLIRKNVVAVPRHVANHFDDAVEGLAVVFGFQERSKTLVSVQVELLCNAPAELGDVALLQLKVPGVELPPPQQEIADPYAVSEPSNVLAFGHPYRMARLMTGDDGETHIHDCRDHKGEGVRATLDTLDSSSGTAVYIPHGGEGEWILFGLLSGGSANGIVNGDILVAPPHRDICKIGKGKVGAVISPLGEIPTAAIDAVAMGVKPDETWQCHRPNDKPRVPKVCESGHPMQTLPLL